MKILIIEDDPIAIKIAELIIKRVMSDGVATKIAHTGETALDICKDSTFDLILVDIGLPDIDGFKVASEIRSFCHHKLTPIYALSAHVRYPDSNDADFVSATTGVITKPLSYEKFQVIISQISSSTIA